MTKQLPERPNLEQLKNQAKTLLKAARAGDAGARSRFRALPALADRSGAEIDAHSLALHDAQSVVAREHGFRSWNALREHVEERTLTFAAAAEELVRSATGDAPGRAQRLLALHSRLAHASLYTELVVGEADAVEARLRADPGLATRAGGPRDWEPLLYVCHTCLGRDAAGRAGLARIARDLLSRGADPNATYVFRWHAELPRTALWGALFATADLSLAEVLLEAGARPTDGVSTHIAAGAGNLAVLDLLHAHGVDVDGLPGGVPPLVHALGWCTDASGPRWLIEHGADPNLAWSDSGEAPLHVAARRWDVALVETLVRHGADVAAPRADGCTPHTLAALHGNEAVAAWLLAHGARDELSPLQRFVAACARADRPEAEAMLRERPTLRDELEPSHHLMLHRPAESGQTAILETMLACGFDPRARDEEGIQTLHRAAMAGHAPAVRVLLSAGAPVDALDDTFAATPLVWAVEGWRYEPAPGADHPAVARLLIEAGSPTTWAPPAGTPSPEGTLERLAELVAAARRRGDA